MPKITPTNQHSVITNQTVKHFLVAGILLLNLVLSACSTTPSNAWGSNTSFSPKWSTIKQAAKESFFDVNTWVPLAGSAIFGATNLDHEVTDYAATHNPIFGSPQNALDSSDKLLDLSRVSLYITTFSTPYASTFEESAKAKINGFSAQVAALALTNNSTGVLKRETKRFRPTNSNDDSFPSAHASSSSVYTSLSRQNINHINMSNTAKTAAKVGMISIASATAWARVEGNVHHPSDVLFGYALGNFFAQLVNKTLINYTAKNHIDVSYRQNQQNSSIVLDFKF